MQKLTLSYIFLMLAFAQGLSAQGVSANIAIGNEKAVGTDYYFDLYIATNPSTSGDLYLADSDFRISFNNALFTSPTFQKRDSNIVVGTAPFTLNLNIGYCSFVPTNDTQANTLLAQDDYHTSMALSMPENNILSVELQGPAPTDQNLLENNVARIDNQVAVHRLGRFYITGYNGSGLPNLTVALTGALDTKVFSYAASPNFNSSSVDLTSSTFPVEWLSFTAEKLDAKTVQLNWITGTEINNDYFVIEKRLENEEFSAIAKVDGAGFSSTSLDYDFEDSSPMAAVVYYRLQQVDFDGSSDFSDVVEVNFDELGLARYATYPNPANEWFTLEAISEKDQEHTYKMLDLRGKTVLSGILGAGMGETRVNVESLAAGTYVLQVKNAKAQPLNMKVTVK
ncbi:MAG: T9SS type A sorting domain-containing protein [Bacteroidia bacterium]